MASISDQEIYERTVNELPFTDAEAEARIRYWAGRSVLERIEAGDEILRRHYKTLGIDVDSIRMDKNIVRITRLGEQGQ